MVVTDLGLFRLSFWVLLGGQRATLKKGNRVKEKTRLLSTHSDLDSQQSLAGIFGIDGELDR